MTSYLDHQRKCKKIFVLFAIFCFTALPGSAQELKMYKTFGGVVFQLDSTTISMKQTMGVLQKNPQAYQEFRKAKANQSAASIMGFAGGLLIGFPVGTAIAGGEPEWGLAAGGAALILGSIPLSRAFRGRALNALDIYNGRQNTSRLKPEFYFFGNGASVVLRF